MRAKIKEDREMAKMMKRRERKRERERERTSTKKEIIELRETERKRTKRAEKE